MSKTMDQLPEIDPFSPEYQSDATGLIERIRADSPLARSARGLEVLGYDGCAEVYANEHYVSATPLMAEAMDLDFSLIKGPGRTLTNSEGEAHTSLRRIVPEQGPWGLLVRTPSIGGAEHAA
jgi:cytochrome P450